MYSDILPGVLQQLVWVENEQGSKEAKREDDILESSVCFKNHYHMILITV